MPANRRVAAKNGGDPNQSNVGFQPAGQYSNNRGRFEQKPEVVKRAPNAQAHSGTPTNGRKGAVCQAAEQENRLEQEG